MKQMNDIKTWTIVGTFSSFLEADRLRNTLVEIHESVKVRRAGKNGDFFRVKIWNSPPPENKKSNKRSKKNENRKIRARQEQS
jgi:hypothetical protein